MPSGCDLAHVGAHRLRRFGEVHQDAIHHVGRDAQHMFGDPAQRQQAHMVVGVQPVVHGVEGRRRGDQVGVGEHGAFGQAGGARRVADHGQVFPAPALHLSRQPRGRVARQCAPLRLHRGKGNQPRVVVLPQPAFLPVDNAAHLGQPVANLQQFVALLLVFGEDHHRVAVVDDIGHLFRAGVGVEADLYAADGQQPQVGPEVEAVVVAHGGDAVAPFHAQGEQTQRQVAHLGIGILPGELLPDAKLLLAQGHLAGGVLFDAFQEKLREGLCAHRPVLMPGPNRRGSPPGRP
jgi:hypothetical protein